MKEKDKQRDGSLDRRTFMKGAATTSLVGAGVSTPAAASGGSQFVLEQGNTEVPITPLSYDSQTIEEFYGFREDDGHPHSNTPTNLARSDTSRLFLWDGPKGLSLVMLHDAPHDGNGGELTFEFTGLPDSGTWAVGDDDPGNDTYFDASRVDWQWGGRNTDGGAYRGLDASGVPFANDLEIRTEDGYQTTLSNGWHYKERFDRGLEGFEGPVWVFVFADNADFDSQPSGELERPFSIDNGELVPQGGSGTEPTNDIYFVLKPGTDESTLKFVAERAGKDNRILFDGETLISNTNNASADKTFSLPGVSDVNVTVTPDFQHGISKWEVLSGDASAPATQTLDMNKPVTIRSAGSGDSSKPSAVKNLLDTKRGQIDSLREIANPPIPKSVVDARAEEFVSTIDANYQSADETTLSQYEEALKRLTAAEEVTETMASAPRKDPDAENEILPKTGEGITSAIILLATRGLGKLGGKLGGLKIFGKIKRFIVKRVQRYAQSALGSLAAKGVVNTRTANKILTKADETAAGLRTLMESDVTGDKLKDASKTVTKRGFKAVADEATPKSVKDKSQGIRDTIDGFFADVMYTYYFANTDVAEVALPSPDDFTLPEYAFEFTVDLPDEHLPDIPFIDEPDKITVEADVDPELPNAPEFDNVDKIEDALDLVSSGLNGLDPTLDDEIEDLANKVESGELNPQDPRTRKNIESLLVNGTESLTDIAESLIAKVEGVAKQVKLKQITLAIAGLMVLAAVLVASGIGAPLALGVLVKLGELAGYLAIISTLVTLTPLIVGGGYLTVLDKAHLLETKALLNTDLQGVNL